jgi:hypothetical protein
MGWRRFFRRAEWDRERREEVESYLQIEADDNVARGVPPDEARAAVLASYLPARQASAMDPVVALRAE